MVLVFLWFSRQYLHLPLVLKSFLHDTWDILGEKMIVRCCLGARVKEQEILQLWQRLKNSWGKMLHFPSVLPWGREVWKDKICASPAFSSDTHYWCDSSPGREIGRVLLIYTHLIYQSTTQPCGWAMTRASLWPDHLSWSEKIIFFEA